MTTPSLLIINAMAAQPGGPRWSRDAGYRFRVTICDKPQPWYSFHNDAAISDENTERCSAQRIHQLIGKANIYSSWSTNDWGEIKDPYTIKTSKKEIKWGLSVYKHQGIIAERDAPKQSLPLSLPTGRSHRLYFFTCWIAWIMNLSPRTCYNAAEHPKICKLNSFCILSPICLARF